LDLLTPFNQARLIDTKLVYPDGSRFVATAKSLQRLEEIRGHRQYDIVARNYL
jgi:hypothetical protein